MKPMQTVSHVATRLPLRSDGISHPCVAGTSEVHIDQRIEQPDTLPPQIELFSLTATGISQIGHLQLAINGCDPILELLRDAGRSSIEHAALGMILVDRGLERLRGRLGLCEFSRNGGGGWSMVGAAQTEQ